VAILVVLQGPDKGRQYQTPKESFVLGRGNVQIPLTDRTISRRHAELHPEEDSWVLHDLGSANGTYVNGTRIRKPVRLKHGDQIKIGATLLVYTGDHSMESIGPDESPEDVLDLDVSSDNMDSAILSTISSEESIVIAGPEVTGAARAWEVMTELTAAIGAIIDPDQLLERVMDVVIDELPVDHGFILLYDKAGEELTPHLVRYRPGLRPHKDKIPTSRRIIQYVLDNRESVLCTNAMTDKRFTTEAGEDSIHSFGLRSVICAPIIVRHQLLGVIHIDSAATTHSYTKEQLRLMSTIGQMTGLAIQNTRLVQQQMKTARLAATGETVAYLSHNIKNILQAMQAGEDLVDIGIEKKNFTAMRQGWRIVQNNLGRIMQMTMNMLNFSKTREPNLQPTDLSQLVSDAVAGLQKKAGERKIKLVLDLEEPFPPIPLDEDGISQVVLNIIDNAIEAVLPETGVVTISTRFLPEEGMADIIVRDNGPGIEKEKLKDIFEPFISSKGQGGTGLGLAVARKIVREHHGRTIVESNPGEGTTFRIRLPAQEWRDASDDTYSGME